MESSSSLAAVSTPSSSYSRKVLVEVLDDGLVYLAGQEQTALAAMAVVMSMPCVIKVEACLGRWACDPLLPRCYQQ